MFSNLGLFDQVPCPLGTHCQLPSCIFTHSDRNVSTKSSSKIVVEEHRSKRIKLAEDDKEEVKSPERPRPKPFFGALREGEHVSSNELEDVQEQELRTPKYADQDRATRRSISPPSRKRDAKARMPSTTGKDAVNAGKEQNAVVKNIVVHETVESLNPRLVTNNPASHSDRTSFVKKLHQIMSDLNMCYAESKDPAKRALHLNKNELVKLVLDEEEEIARGKPATYSNRIRQRIGAVSRMTVEQWQIIALRVHPQDHNEVQPMLPLKKETNTDLSVAQEMQLLPQLAANQSYLENYGYVVSPPDDWDIRETRAAVALCRGYEQCDRCGSRFQVFSDRREDGALTDGGQCTHHHGRVFQPKRNTGQPVDTAQEKRYTCCHQALGTPGCTIADTHVFKFDDKKRLASVLQFRRTPSNYEVPTDRAVAFDCEMVYTVFGMELARLTAVSWPSGEQMLDILVKPFGAILDLNTRFSGISADDFANAVPYEYESASIEPATNGLKPTLNMVQSPDIARETFFKLISPKTALIGHALENDLIATRIIHPNIVDTVVLFPHPRGLPYRFALRTLTQDKLGRTIQAGGAAGHDSKEDARAAGDLVRVALAAKWKNMKKGGYSFAGGKLVSPPGKLDAPALLDGRPRTRSQMGADHFSVGSLIETTKADVKGKAVNLDSGKAHKRSQDEVQQEDDMMDFGRTD